LTIQHSASSALHHEGSSGNIPALDAIPHPAIHVALDSSLGDETHIQGHGATNAKHLLKPTFPLHGIEMLPQGVTWGIIEDQAGLVETANVGDMHGMAIDRRFSSSDRTVEFVVERMVDDAYKGTVCTGQGDCDARKILPTNVGLCAIQWIDNPGIGRGGGACARLFADDGVPGKVAAEDTANHRIREGIDIRHHFLTVFVGNLQGSKTMLQ